MLLYSIIFFLVFSLSWLAFCVLGCSSGTKLSEDSRKYGSENTCTNGNVLTRAALSYGRARAQMEKERGNMLKALGTQVCLLSHHPFKVAYLLSDCM